MKVIIPKKNITEEIYYTKAPVRMLQRALTSLFTYIDLPALSAELHRALVPVEVHP